MKNYVLAAMSLVVTLNATAMQPQPSSLSSLRANGASVLPVFTHKSGERYVILGREVGGHDKGTYDAFGGGANGNESGLQAATREFFEESIAKKTMELSEVDIKNHLQSPFTEYVIGYKSGKNSNFIVYITNLEPKLAYKLKENFNSERNKLVEKRNKGAKDLYKYIEKDKLAQVKWSDFQEAIKNAHSSKDVTVSATLVDPETGKLKKDKQGNLELKTIQIRPWLAKSLQPFFKDEPFESGARDNERFYEKAPRTLPIQAALLGLEGKEEQQ